MGLLIDCFLHRGVHKGMQLRLTVHWTGANYNDDKSAVARFARNNILVA